MDDPKVKQAIAETEKELNKREMGLMERHKDVLEHGKATLEMKQDLAKQQVKGNILDKRLWPGKMGVLISAINSQF